MTIADIANRIEEIRSNLGLRLAGGLVPSKYDNSGNAFASALDSAGGTGLPATAAAATGGVDGADVVQAAEKYLGVPYKFGGTNPESGLDCSGFVQRAYADLGITLPRVAKDQAKQGTPVAGLAQAKPGDLVAFHSPVDHIGIYVGDGKMVVAPHTGDHVKIQKITSAPSTIRRIIPDAPTTPYPAVRPAALTRGGSAGPGAVPYAQMFQAAGQRHGVDPKLLAAVAKVESNYNPDAVSSAGAQGLMQIMPSTAESLGINPLDPAQAIDGAARILAGNLKSFDSVPLALAAYNAGGGAVRKYNGIPPYAETQAYVPKVEAALAALSGRSFA
jgi:peptidoglycan DL-endopeptidase CwlO